MYGNGAPRLSVVVREVARAFERGRHAEAVRVVARRARREFLAEEEEQLVVASGLADGTADREAPVALVDLGLRSPLRMLVLRVGIPLRVALDVVDRSVEPIRSALGGRRDLQAARPAVLGLVRRREDLDFLDRLDVHLQEHRVAAGVHRRHAVHHDVVRAAAAETRGVGARAGDARRQRRELHEAAIRNRQVLARRRSGR